MIRLLAALGVFLVTGMWFLGADHGQYINPPRPQPQQVADGAPAKRQVFIPAQPIAGAPAAGGQPFPEAVPEVTPASGARVDPQTGAPVVQDVPAAPEPSLIGITVKAMRAPGGATVHGGPGIAFPVLGRLHPGGVVMVAATGATQGWIQILVDGGGSGWVAAKLLRE